ncbi:MULTISPECIES: restriction endonuclease subunit S [Proteus]|uniref:restriction endonuclease subunit S n=1 Tax=Proteus TaxID=583 RepID=UPI0034DCF6AA|nr:restriction endonuclease subunit S [Proteus mirabilis]
MVPNGWREGRVRDLIKSLNAGVSVNSEDDGNLSSSYKILKTSCVSKGIFDPNKTKSVVEDVEISRLKEPVLCDSIIISRMNTPALVGANGYIENGIENTYLPDRLWQAKPKSNDVNMKWLGYWFASSHTRYTLSSTATGTSGSMKNITKSDVLNIKIDIPPLPEQRKIAKILSTWDKAISTTERLIDNSKQQKKALMQQLLTGKKRLLDDSGKPFEGEWIEYYVKDFGLVVTGNTPSKSDEANYGTEFSWATAEDFKGKYVSNTNIKLSSHGVKSARLVPKGSVLVTCIASIGKNAIANEELATNQQINAVKVNKKHCNEFLYYQIENNRHKLIAWAGTTAVPILNKSSFEKIKLKAPSIIEQRKIASVLSNSDKEIEVLQQQLADLKQEKKALMQQLLTGKRRVIVDEKEVA